MPDDITGELIGPVQPEHYAEILRNNQAFVHWLSPLDEIELAELVESAPYARQINAGQGVLTAFTWDNIYENENVDWLSERFENFVYIDRVIISAQAQGKGYGQKLYADIERFAKAGGYAHIVCEVNTVPDNPGSHIFHERMGFLSCGEADILDGAKRVRYYVKRI